MDVIVRNGAGQSHLPPKETAGLCHKNAETVPGGVARGGGCLTPLMSDSISGQAYLPAE